VAKDRFRIVPSSARAATNPKERILEFPNIIFLLKKIFPVNSSEVQHHKVQKINLKIVAWQLLSQIITPDFKKER
jgi:hypothetical protein